MKKFFKLAVAMLLVITFIGMVVYVNLYEKQDPNIFDEIYFEMDQVPLPTKVTRKDYTNFDDNEKEYPVVQFTYNRNVSSEYEDIFFEKNSRDRSLDICFTKKLDKDIDLKMWYIYDFDNKKADQELVIIDNQGTEKRYIDGTSQIKSYLKRYHVTSAQIDQSYKSVIKDLILKDWTKVYDSEFSPSDYDKIEVKKQWED